MHYMTLDMISKIFIEVRLVTENLDSICYGIDFFTKPI